MKAKVANVLAVALLLAGVVSIPMSAVAATLPSLQQTQKAEQSVSGKIVSVRSDGFTLEYTDGQGAAKKADFNVTAETKVTGKLESGKSAEVTFRAENNRWIALNVMVNAAE